MASGIDAIYNKRGQILNTDGIFTFLSAKREMLFLNAFIRYRLMRKSGTFSDGLK